MNNKITYRYRNQLFIVISILMIVGFFTIRPVEASSDFDFSINIENHYSLVRAGEKIGIKVYINSTFNISENVFLKGEWIDNIPKNVTVNISKPIGYPSFFSYINFSSAIDSDMGIFVYNLSAELDDVIKFINMKIEITYNLNISLQTDQENYQKGEEIHVFGNISSFHEIDMPDIVNISFQYENWRRAVNLPIINNSFEYYYNISYGDPEGIWNVTSNILDDEDILFSSEISLSIIPPPDVLRYSVEIYSPPEKAVYYRGSTFNISVFVTEAGVGVNNASTSCILNTDEKITLTEIKDGYYQGSYTIPWNSQIGDWSLSMECTKESAGYLKAGGSYTFMNVKPARINLDLLEPSLNDFNIDEPITIKAELSYPDGETIEDALVTAITPSRNMTLIDQLNGTYITNYKTNTEDIGSWFIEITAMDKYGNKASTAKIINIFDKKQIDFPISSILGIMIISIVGFFVLNMFRRNLSSQHLNDIEEEIKEEEKLQNETAVKYYKTGSISRNTYDALMKQHTERLGELKKERRKIKK